jgi:hypothetical protein
MATEYKQVITEDELEQLVKASIQQVITEDVKKNRIDDTRPIDSFEFGIEVQRLLLDQIGPYTTESIINAAENSHGIDTDRLSGQSYAETLSTILNDCLLDVSRDQISDDEEQIDDVYMIHEALEDIKLDLDNDMNLPSEILHAAKQFHFSNSTEDNEASWDTDSDSINPEEFNETHVKGIAAINYRNTELIEFLHKFLESQASINYPDDYLY